MDAESGALAAAAVVSRAFGMDGAPEELLESFAPLPSDGPLLAWTVELTADGEHVAFLVHAYPVGSEYPEGGAGRFAMDEDLRAMSEAAELAAPGPRLVARAEVGAWGIVVAASPATLSRLRGAGPDETAPRQPAPSRERARAADALLSALQSANRSAAAYIAAVGDGSGEPSTGERALALFVADAPSLANLTRALRIAVARAAPAQPSAEPDPT